MNIDFHSRKNIIFLAVIGVLIVGVLVVFWATYLRNTKLYTGLFQSEAAAPLCASVGSVMPVSNFQRAIKSGVLIAKPNWAAGTAKITNNSDCKVPLSLASYKMFGTTPNTGTQTFFASSGVVTVNQRSSRTLKTTVPTCNFQIDIWYGKAPKGQGDPDRGDVKTKDILWAGDWITNLGYCQAVLPATLKVIKTVINDDQVGSADASAFSITVTGGNPSLATFPGAGSPGTTVTLDAGSYSVDEADDLGYTKTLSTDCTGTIAAGETKTCTITNNDIAATLPQISIVKSADPTSLPFGGGSVTYAYSITNPGNVTLTNISLIDDKCSGPNRTGGDANSNDKLETTETWAYTCVTNLTTTTTNTATVTGNAGTATVTDNDSATVTVRPPPDPATLTVIKTVIGGIKTAGEFNITVTGTNPSPATFDGNESGTTVTLEAGTYSVDEVDDPDYTKTPSADCIGTIAAGQTKTCTITNTYSSLPPPSNVVISALPACSVSGYSATITWTGAPNTTSGNFFVEISDDQNFSAPFSKTVASSPTDSTGFMRGSDTLELLPDTTYYARVSNN